MAANKTTLPYLACKSVVNISALMRILNSKFKYRNKVNIRNISAD